MKGEKSIMTERKDDYLDREFNFDKAIRNPYAKELKKQITIKLFLVLYHLVKQLILLHIKTNIILEQ